MSKRSAGAPAHPSSNEATPRPVTALSHPRVGDPALRECFSFSGPLEPRWCKATHSADLPRAADGCIARMMPKPKSCEADVGDRAAGFGICDDPEGCSECPRQHHSGLSLGRSVLRRSGGRLRTLSASAPGVSGHPWASAMRWSPRFLRVTATRPRADAPPRRDRLGVPGACRNSSPAWNRSRRLPSGAARRRWGRRSRRT